ncbi:MAG TPA: Flp pilus assembly protein CpaB [Pseudonocardiaceae bacterium]
MALALRPQPGTATVLVAARDLPPGVTLTPADVRTAEVPAGLVPAGTLGTPSDVDGRVLAGATRQGEPITDVRLLGEELTRLLAPGADAATVPLRLSDADVAGLLAPGSTVDVVGVGERGAEPVVLAERATVLTVLEEGSDGVMARREEGRLVVVMLPRHTATQVAAASLSQSITVTLR